MGHCCHVLRRRLSVCVHQVQRDAQIGTLLTPFHPSHTHSLLIRIKSNGNENENESERESVCPCVRLPKNRKIPIIKIDDSNKNLLPFCHLSYIFGCYWFPIHIYYYQQSTLLVQHTMNFAFDCEENMLCIFSHFCLSFVHVRARALDKKGMENSAELCRKTRSKCTKYELNIFVCALWWFGIFFRIISILSLCEHVSARPCVSLSKYIQIIRIFRYNISERERDNGKKLSKYCWAHIFIMMCRKWIASCSLDRNGCKRNSNIFDMKRAQIWFFSRSGRFRLS